MHGLKKEVRVSIAGYQPPQFEHVRSTRGGNLGWVVVFEHARLKGDKDVGLMRYMVCGIVYVIYICCI